jgi:hypothetical protein
MILQYDWHGLQKIISGGQDGVDRGALDAARDAGFPTGGMAPAEWLTTRGPDPSLAAYGLEEAAYKGYPYRTERNVLDSDGTLIIASDLTSAGTQLTMKYCHKHGRPFYTWRLPNGPGSIEGVKEFLQRECITTLNVAGNHKHAEYHHAATYKIIRGILYA